MSESYTLPEPGSIVTPDEAGVEVDRILGEASQDKNHPYTNGNHILHKKFVDHITAMYALRANGDTRTPLQKTIDSVCDEGLAGQVERQNKLVKEAEAEMEKLEKLGFEPIEIPDDVQPFQVAAWKMQRLNAERNFRELTPILEKELTTLRAKGMDTFRGFINDSGFTPEERSEHIELILKRIYAANDQKYGRRKSED
jgi:hypothetical protein